MQSRSRLTQVLFLVVALVAGLSPAAVSGQEDPQVVRHAGADRVQTAAALAVATPSSDTVVIARADDFPDALAGAFLAAPVLLTGPDALPRATVEAIEGLEPTDAVVLGGERAVGQAVVDELEAMGLDVERLAGDSRVDTAVAIATSGREVGRIDGQTTAVLAAAGTFADALVAGPLAAGAGLPILLTDTAEVPQATLAALARLDVEQVLIVGGTAVVSPEVLDTVRSEGYDVRRLAGDSRQATAAEVARYAGDVVGWTPTGVVLATGADFPDALAAAPLAGALRAPLLLTGGTAAADAVAGLIGCRVARVIVAGGTAVVADADVTPVVDALGSSELCPVDPSLFPTQAVVRVGETHEIAVDLYGGSDAFAQASGGIAGGPEVRFTIVPDTLSRAMATIVSDDVAPADLPLGGGGMEAAVMADDDGIARLRFTSSTPGLAVIRACATGEDEDMCVEGAVQFSARYTAAVGADGEGLAFVSLDGDRLCASMGGVESDGIAITTADGMPVTAIDDGTGCIDGVGVAQQQVDDDPVGYGITVGDTFTPFSVIGSEYAEWESQQAVPFVPGPATQGNTELVAHIDGLNDVTALNFIDYGDRDVLFATGRFGLQSFDVTDPSSPVFLDSLEMPDFWENEDMDVDVERKLVMLSRDPRAYGGSTDDGVAGVYLIDAADPAALRRIVFHELPAGHTATCVRSQRADGSMAVCDHLWSGGPATGTHQPDEWGGRPVFVTDITDPERPFTHPMPLLTNQNDGVTDYAHDVQVDADGLAWVSSRGGVYGFHTFGTHVDPLTGATRVATPADPVPFAGGTLEGEDSSGGVIHNSYRPVGEEADLGADLEASGFAEGELIYATDEAFTSACTSDGLFNIVTLEGSFAGEGFVSTPEEPFRLRTVGTWSPIAAGEPGPIPLCSAHYFDMKDSIVAYSWYGQGTRFVDVSDPTDPIQVAFHRPLVNLSFAPRWRGDVVFVADSLRGIDIVRLTDGAFEAQAAHEQIAAPALPSIGPDTVSAALLGLPVDLGGRSWTADPAFGWACWIPTRRD